MKKCMRYYLGNYLYKIPGIKDYMSLAKIEELLVGY